MREIDYTKPLTEDDEEYLRERMPNERVDYIKAKAAGDEFTGGVRFQDPEGALAHAQSATLDGDQKEAPGENQEPQLPLEMQEGDDPADYTVEQVKAYLEDASDEEHDRVIAAEEQGEARKGILG